MQLGLIGLGRMGGNMRERLRRAGHEVIGFDRNPEVSDAAGLAELVEQARRSAGGLGRWCRSRSPSRPIDEWPPC